MRKIFIYLLIILPFAVSCEAKHSFNGAWTSKDAYDYWKSGESEEIRARKTKIGNTFFLVLTNSITISTEEEPMTFLVPGGKWKILSIDKIDDAKYAMNMESLRQEGANGIIIIHTIDARTIYFTKGNMNDRFEKEVNQSFLMLGEKHLSYRCDIVSE